MNNIFLKKYKSTSIKNFKLSQDFKQLLFFLINSDQLNILLVGENGSGKTSILNAIVKDYYGNDYDSANVLYINTLKEQGIHYYRNEVKIFCQTRSTQEHKKKIVVLDDMDMINEQSQQIFRNCIDKYRDNISFICSCTNIQKVIDSIESRIIVLKIPSLTFNDLLDLTNEICKNEKIQLTEEDKKSLIIASNNSIRNLYNCLEKCKIINKKITPEILNEISSDIDYKKFEEFTILISDKNKKTTKSRLNSAIKLIYNIYNSGYSIIDILDNYFLFVKQSSIIEDEQKYLIIKYICKYITIFYELHESKIELALFTNNLIQIFSS